MQTRRNTIKLDTGHKLIQESDRHWRYFHAIGDSPIEQNICADIQEEQGYLVAGYGFCGYQVSPANDENGNQIVTSWKCFSSCD